jgi:hypothetical protein
MRGVAAMARRLFDVEGVVLGLCLVGLGTVLTLGTLGRIDALSTLRAYWPTALVAWGLVELAAFAIRRQRN